MSKIADDGMRTPPPEDPVEERTCPRCKVSYRVSAAGLAAHVAACDGQR